MNRPDWIVIHHSLTSDNVLLSDFEAIRRYHVETMGFKDVAYHAVIERVKGVLTAQKGRNDNETGAHCVEMGMNSRSIGICVVGNFDLAPPDSETLLFLRDMCFAYMVNYNISPIRVIGHRDAGLMVGYDWRRFGSTGIRQFKTCPGEKFPMEAFIESLRGRNV